MGSVRGRQVWQKEEKEEKRRQEKMKKVKFNVI
jgi:hypothetical protein